MRTQKKAPLFRVFARRYGVTVRQVRELARLIGRYAVQMERCINGDPHPFVFRMPHLDPDGTRFKNDCSDAYHADSERTAAALTALAKRLGFDGVDYSVGLYPCLIHQGQHVHW